MTVVVTDAKYRASLAAVRSLARAGHRVVLTQTARDIRANEKPVAFYSKYVSEALLLDASVNDENAYLEKLIAVLEGYDTPVLFPVGAKTTALVSRHADELSRVCTFTVANEDALAAANDKSLVKRYASALGIRVPKAYEGTPDSFPVIIKPRCGEAYGLKAEDRYMIAHTPDEYAAAYKKMEIYGGDPVVEELVSGDGIGISLLMSREGRAVSAICHRRVREYSVNGGPSACCESFYDEKMVADAERLLAELGFSGMAMVEFKGEYLLEINPRVWGSFPLTDKAGASFADDYVKLSLNEEIDHPLDNYKCGVRMNFLFNDIVASTKLLLAKHCRKGLDGFADIILGRACDAIYDKDDKAPFWQFVRTKLSGR
ncbi:MAG: ATP-grasp domain-containing protein [Clostridia bacterium]|nr:ATP-grasp domain-containing protein [Clostridia bacterium]